MNQNSHFLNISIVLTGFNFSTEYKQMSLYYFEKMFISVRYFLLKKQHNKQRIRKYKLAQQPWWRYRYSFYQCLLSDSKSKLVDCTCITGAHFVQSIQYCTFSVFRFRIRSRLKKYCTKAPSKTLKVNEQAAVLNNDAFSEKRSCFV